MRWALCAVGLLSAALPAMARNVGYRVEFVGGMGCHVVQVDLNSPWAKVTPITSLRFPGGAEAMTTMCRRRQPTAAITGAFFSKTSLLPVGDIVCDGRLVHFGGMGSALAITPTNRVVFQDVPWGRHQDWTPFETVLACGPRLLASGQVALAPSHQGFSDPHVLGRAPRTAVGLTPANKLLMVATRETITLWDLAKLMRGLGCIDAINLDGGSSTGMYYRGKAIVRPGRSLVNMLAVYESVEVESRTCNCELPLEREAIQVWRSKRAYEVYMKAQTPLAKGNLDEAVRLLEKAGTLDAANASYQVKMAEVLASSGDSAGASAAWGRAGTILADKRMYADATKRLRQALQANPDNPAALARLPGVYRARGMEAEAASIERDLNLRELRKLIVANHAELMAEIAARAYELAGEPASSAKAQPVLASVMAERSYADMELGVCMQLPADWQFVFERDASSLVMEHRARAELAHVRVIRVPERVSLAQLMELYFERSFPHEAVGLPILPSAQRVTRATEVLTPSGGVFCQTTFTRRGDLVWILSLATTSNLRETADPDLRAVADGFTLLR